MMNEKMMETVESLTVESLYAGVRRGLLEVHEATDRMCGYLRCLCDMGMITENTRSKMYTDFVEKVLELETK